jgi:hypothetical protein
MCILQTVHHSLILYLPLSTVHKTVASHWECLPNLPLVHTHGWWIPTIVLRTHEDDITTESFFLLLLLQCISRWLQKGGVCPLCRTVDEYPPLMWRLCDTSSSCSVKKCDKTDSAKLFGNYFYSCVTFQVTPPLVMLQDRLTKKINFIWLSCSNCHCLYYAAFSIFPKLWFLYLND